MINRDGVVILSSNQATANVVRNNLWGLANLRSHPLRYFGRFVHVVFRILFGLFFLLAGFNKVIGGWLISDYLKDVFLQRLTELNPESFPSMYLENFAIPVYLLIAWIVTWGELFAGLGLILGLATRPSAFVALFILVNLAIGGYYDASLLPFFLLCTFFLIYPSGQWLGVDRIFHRRYPHLIWFR